MPDIQSPRPGRVRSGSPTGDQDGHRPEDEQQSKPGRTSGPWGVPREGAVLPPRQRYHR